MAFEALQPILLRETMTKPRKSAAGRKAFDRVMLFRMLVLQRMHSLSDDRLEYQVRDRLSFMRFLGLDLSGVVPDAKTMWVFREELKENQMIERLFARFDECLRELDVELKSGRTGASVQYDVARLDHLLRQTLVP